MTESLESQIKRAERNAQAKMKRLKSKGVDVTRTVFNPIRMTEGLNYNQRRTYLNQLKKFTSKETQFYSDARGGVISGKDWRRYKEAEKRANDMVRNDLARYKNVREYSPDPNRQGALTVPQALEFTRPKPGKMMTNPSGTGMHVVERTPDQINGPAALRRLTEQMENKTKPSYRKRKLSEGREQFNKMLDMMDQDELRDLGMSLTDEQFHVLWNYTNLANSIALSYEIMMQQMERGPKEFHASIVNTANRRARGLIEWASRL